MHRNLKFLHMKENFSTDISLGSVTNMRYGYLLNLLHQHIFHNIKIYPRNYVNRNIFVSRYDFFAFLFIGTGAAFHQNKTRRNVRGWMESCCYIFYLRLQPVVVVQRWVWPQLWPQRARHRRCCANKALSVFSQISLLVQNSVAFVGMVDTVFCGASWHSQTTSSSRIYSWTFQGTSCLLFVP